MKVVVRTTTEIYDGEGILRTRVTKTAIEDSGNPLFIARVAHRRAEQNADETRVMLQTQYGEVDDKWLPKTPIEVPR